MLVDVESAGMEPRDALLASFTTHLEAHVSGWFGGSGAVHVRHVRTQVRRNATLYYFDAQVGDSG